MPTEAQEPNVPTPQRRRPAIIDPFAAELLDIHEDQTKGLLAEVAKMRTILDRGVTWSIRAVIGGVGTFMLGVFVLIVYVVSLLASQRGVDVGEAAKATKDVATVVAPAQPDTEPPAPEEDPDG